MPESIPATLIIETLKDTFRDARAALARENAELPRHDHLGWILSVPDTHQKTVLAARSKSCPRRRCTSAAPSPSSLAMAMALSATFAIPSSPNCSGAINRARITETRKPLARLSSIVIASHKPPRAAAPPPTTRSSRTRASARSRARSCERPDRHSASSFW